MAFQEKQILGFFLFIWLSFIKVSGFSVFNEGNILNSLGSFYKNARAMESFDRGDEKPRSGEQVGRLLVWQDQVSNSHGDARDSFSSEFGFQSQPDENAYQSDDSEGWMKLQPLWGQVYGPKTLYTPTIERLLDLKPKVDCVGNLMKLTIHGREAPFGSRFLIDRGSIQPLPLSQLPSECGHRFQRTWRDFAFIIPYDGCYVSHEKDTFVLPLLWWGLPVKMSCSSLTSAQRAPTVSCYMNGMIVRLYRRVSENLKIKVANEWQPLLTGSARCGYSLVSHAEGVVIHAPYMPCSEPKDGMFTLSLAAEKEFNLSCPALTLSLPDHPPMNYATTSMPNAPLTTTTTRPVISSLQKLPIPDKPHFKPLHPSYPFLLYPPNVPPTVLPQGPPIVDPPSDITLQQQTPVYIGRLQTWYPWKPKPSFGLNVVPSQSTDLQYQRKPLLPPTKAPETPFTPLPKPTSVPQLTSTMPVVPPMQWPPMFPPRNMVYPLYPRKPWLVAPSSTVFPQDPYWHYSQNQPGPSHAPPTPAPTRKAEPPLFHPWYNSFPPRLSAVPSVMPPVPTKVPEVSTTHKSKRPPLYMESDFPPSTSPTSSVPTLPEVNTPAPTNACLTPSCLSHAHCCHSKNFCSCPPLMSYHHHNHHYFGHPPMFQFDTSSRTKISGPILSSHVLPVGSAQFVQGMGYNYNPLSSDGAVVPPASHSIAKQYSNGPVAEPVVYLNQSPKPAVYQAEMERYVPLWGHDTRTMLPASKVPFYEKMVQYAISLKPTMPPVHGKNRFMNHWYQATYSNAKPPISFDPSVIPSQPEQPVMNPQQFNPQSVESLVPVFRDTYWVPAVQTNQDALLSSYHPDGLYEASIHRRPRNVESWTQR